MKIKVVINGVEQEIELTPEQIALVLNGASDDDVLKLMDKKGLLKETPKKEDKPKPEKDPLVAELVEQVKTLSKALSEESKAREESLKTIQKEAEKRREKEIKDLLDERVSNGAITPEQRTKWEERLKKDFDTNSEVLKELPKNPSIKNKDKKQNTEEDKTKTTPEPASTEAEKFQQTREQVRNLISESISQN